MANTKLAYFAGLVDGEGSICIKRTHASNAMRSPSYIFSLTIEMADPRPVDAFCAHFGLRKTFSSSRWRARANHRRMHVAHVGGRRGIVILRRLLPYLVAKPEETRLAIAFYQRTVASQNRWAVGRNRRPVPKWLLSRRHRYYLLMKKFHVRRRFS
ncbi:MAG: hypothetical protein HY323_09150 [Betaproteobacteria bacterium]|nr:hypothetical protein [Betaproteobacteria bacterium]